MPLCYTCKVVGRFLDRVLMLISRLQDNELVVLIQFKPEYLFLVRITSHCMKHHCLICSRATVDVLWDVDPKSRNVSVQDCLRLSVVHIP